MNTPKVQTEADDPPAHAVNPANPKPGEDHGVPDAAPDGEPMGSPSSDRHESETVPAKT